MGTIESHLVDIRNVSSPERHALISRCIEALREDESFIFVAGEDPKQLLYQLQVERESAFDWSPLEEGPDLWRVEVGRRRKEDPRGGSISEFLGWDHDRLDALLGEVLDLASAGSRVEASARFGEFRTGLLRHIRMEEEILFPTFEKVTGIRGGGPTSQMRVEHEQIKGLLARVSDALATPEGVTSELGPLHATLLAVLGEHNEKEERVVYPMTDGELSPPEREKLVSRLQAV